MFNLEKAAEAAAYLLFKNGGSMEKLKLNKLLYFAEKQSILERGTDLTSDVLCSHNFGPILENSDTFFRNGPKNTYEVSVWGKWFFPESDKKYLELKNKNLTSEELEDKLSLLSYEDTDILDAVYSKFGSTPWKEFIKLTHTKTICPEWQEPRKHPNHEIKIKDLCRLNGKNQKETNSILNSLKLNREMVKGMQDFADDRKF